MEQLRRRDVEGVLRVPRTALGLAEGGTDREQDVGLVRRLVGDACAPDARESEGKRMGFGKGALENLVTRR